MRLTDSENKPQINSSTLIDLHHDYLQFFKLRAPLSTRKRMLGELLACNPGHWPVIGITAAALEIFAEHGFERKARMGINRAHLVRRYDWYGEMLRQPMEFVPWKEFYEQHDRTVLSTSAQNMGITEPEFIPIDAGRGLFRAKSYAWTHGSAEREFLRSLYNLT